MTDAIAKQLQRLNEEVALLDIQIDEVESALEAASDNLRLKIKLDRLVGRQKDLEARRKALEDSLAGTAREGGLAGPSGAGLHQDHKLTAFLSELKGATVTYLEDDLSLLTLSNGAHFPDDKYKRSQLLIRPCYEPLFQRVQSNTGFYDSVNDWLVTGTPGIGKSWWIWYAIHRIVQCANPPAVVWQTLKAPDRRVLFQDGKAYIGGSTSFKQELQQESTWYLVDGMNPDAAEARTIMISSPKRKVYKEFIKGRPQIRLTMPLWTWPELSMARSKLYYGVQVTEKRAQYLFDMLYGGVIRLVLEAPADNPESDDQLELDSALAAMDYMQVAAAALGTALDIGPEASHRILHQDADPFTFKRQPYRFATCNASKLFIGDAITNFGVQLDVLLTKSGSNVAGWRGIVFEAVGHNMMIQGGCFPSRILDAPPSSAFTSSSTASGSGASLASVTTPLTVPASGEEVFFSSSTKTANMQDFKLKVSGYDGVTPLYLRPSNSTLPAIDAALLHPAGFQVLQFTISKERIVNEELLEKNLQCLPYASQYFMDWVVPPDVFDSFTVKQLSRADPNSRVARTVMRVIKLTASAVKQQQLPGKAALACKRPQLQRLSFGPRLFFA